MDGAVARTTAKEDSGGGVRRNCEKAEKRRRQGCGDFTKLSLFYD